MECSDSEAECSDSEAECLAVGEYRKEGACMRDDSYSSSNGSTLSLRTRLSGFIVGIESSLKTKGIAAVRSRFRRS